jgi:hypothetical protein
MEPLAASGGLRELLEKFVDALVPFGCQPSDRRRQVLAVVVGRRVSSST